MKDESLFEKVYEFYERVIKDYTKDMPLNRYCHNIITVCIEKNINPYYVVSVCKAENIFTDINDHKTCSRISNIIRIISNRGISCTNNDIFEKCFPNSTIKKHKLYKQYLDELYKLEEQIKNKEEER